eukprot:UN26960
MNPKCIHCGKEYDNDCVMLSHMYFNHLRSKKSELIKIDGSWCFYTIHNTTVKIDKPGMRDIQIKDHATMWDILTTNLITKTKRQVPYIPNKKKQQDPQESMIDLVNR